MFITQRKRIVYDQQGALYKIDVLRTVRRNDAPSSQIQEEKQDQMNSIMDDRGGRVKQQQFNIGKVGIVLIAILLGIYIVSKFSISQISLGAAKFKQAGKQAATQQSEISFNELQRQLAKIDSQFLSFSPSLASRINCKVDANDNATCFFTIGLSDKQK